MLHMLTDTDELNNDTLYAPRYEQAFWPEGKKRPHYDGIACTSYQVPGNYVIDQI